MNALSKQLFAALYLVQSNVGFVSEYHLKSEDDDTSIVVAQSSDETGESEEYEFALTRAGKLSKFGEMVAVNLNGEAEPIVENNHHVVAAVICGWFDGVIE